MKRPPTQSRRGVVLLWAIFSALVIFASTYVAGVVATASKKVSDTNRDEARARYLSLGATSHAALAIQDALLTDSTPPSTGMVNVEGSEASYAITLAEGPTVIESGPGLNRVEYVYQIEGTAAVDRVQGHVKRVVRADVVPLFQFALYYEEDMDFLYPAPMVISGPVHCNSDIYIYAQHGLDFDTNYMRAAGNLYQRPHFSEWSSVYNWGPNNPATIRRWVADPFDASEPSQFVSLETKTQLDDWGIPSTSGFDSDFGGYDGNGDGDYDDPGDWTPFAPRVVEQFSEPDFYTDGTGQTLMTSEHGVKPVLAPEIGDFNMFVESSGGDYEWNSSLGVYVEVAAGTGTHEKGPFFANAGLSIVSYPGGTWSAFDSSGNDVSLSLAAAVSQTTMYDARQAEGSGDSIQMTVIDMDALNSSGLFPANGLLFVAGYGNGDGTDVKGFQLTEGELLAGNLTVVSPDSLYVHGDFNTQTEKSAAVMADAVNLLSNDWDNTKSPGELPTASSTTYNMAVLTGDVEATADAFNGGPHNLPRFHERWSNRTCEIKGSLVALGHSERATGTFHVGGDYYRPPRREWSYDTKFNRIDNLPPFTPNFVDVVDLAVW